MTHKVNKALKLSKVKEKGIRKEKKREVLQEKMASKVVVMLVLCYTFIIAVQTIKAEFLLVEYGKCFKNCHDNCMTQGKGEGFCKLRCDNECMAKKTAGKDTISSLFLLMITII